MPKSSNILSKMDVQRGIATLTLNRPEKRNALSKAMLHELADAIHDARANEDIHCIILDAAGDNFSSGLDLYDLREDWKNGSKSRVNWNDYAGTTMAIVKLLRDARQITIASVQGYCLGGGMVLMNACDLAFAADDAQIGMPEIIRGSYGRAATPTLFLSRVPLKTAFFIQLTGINFSGMEAARVGLVSLSKPANELSNYVQNIACSLATRDPMALAHAKIAAYTEIDLPFDLAIKADDAIGHRMKYYTDALTDVEGYLKSQKGGTNLHYRIDKNRSR